MDETLQQEKIKAADSLIRELYKDVPKSKWQFCDENVEFTCGYEIFQGYCSMKIKN